MTELRQRMLEELQRRNFAPSTIRYYIRTVRDFAAYFHKSPDQLGAEQLRQFQLHMLRDQKLATGTVENRMTSLHFFFKKVLKRYDPELYDMQLTRVPKKLPVVLSAEEVEKLIAAAPNIRYRTILLLLLRYRCSAIRSRAVEDRRHRQPANGHPRPCGEELARSGTAAHAKAARCPAGVLASLQSEAEGLLVSNAIQEDR